MSIFNLLQQHSGAFWSLLEPSGAFWSLLEPSVKNRSDYYSSLLNFRVKEDNKSVSLFSSESTSEKSITIGSLATEIISFNEIFLS